MADKETGLNIPVNAVANKNSAKEAVNELGKNVLSSLKDGYIEIPAELKVPIKGASKDLQKAQKDVIKQWEKTFKEGFSSSAKDLDALTEAYQRFKKLAGQQHKAGTKQSRGISAIMGEQIQAYNMSKKDTQTVKNELNKQIKKAQRRNTKRNMTSEEKKLLKEEIDSAITQDYKRKGYNKFSKELTKGASRAKAAVPGSPTNLGLRSPAMGGPYVTRRTLQMSELSPYGTMDDVRLAKERNEIREQERKSLKIKIDKDYKIGGKDNKIGVRGSDRPQSGTEYELIKKALLTELSKIQGGLIKGKPSETSQKLIDQVLANLTYDEQNGVDPLKSVMSIHNMLQKRYDTRGKIGSTDGEIKGEGPNQKEANETLTKIYKILGGFIEARQSIVDNVLDIKSALLGKTASSKGSLYAQELNKIQSSQQMEAMRSALEPLIDNTEALKIQGIREIGRQSMADQAAGRTSRSALSVATDTLGVARDDASTGLNSENRTQDLIDAVKGSQNVVSVLEEIRDILQRISNGGTTGGGSRETGKKTNEEVIRNLPDLFRQFVNGKWTTAGLIDKTDYTKRRIQLPSQEQWDVVSNKQKNTINDPVVIAKIEKELEEINKGTHELQQRTFLEPSDISASQKGFIGTLKKVFRDFIPETEVERIMSANAKEQARMRAERIEMYGLNRGRQLTDTGDIADVKRTKSLFGWIYRNDEKNKELFQDVKLTPGFTGENRIDTTDIMKSLNKVLSGPEMFKAQTGGTLRNIIGSMTGYIGMPSIEKSRTQAEGLNQVMANVRTEVLGLIQDIQAKEATLIGMQEKGTARFDKEGRITDDSSLSAKNTFTKLEEQKQVLRSALAEVAMIDDIIGKTGGKVSKIIKNLGFVMPELMQNNTIIQNINAGLDKNGKALKFQTRLAEILNYSFQLMSRYIGQIIKNWIWMINPLNIIKQRFDDFASYDPKWQRTMNVIKYNLRDIIRPFMEWIAQKLVNIIGFFDIISMKIQEAFGYTPISLFDQKNADEFKKTYESITDISASFDELHDIGSSSSENDPDNLFGDIYKPELSQGWIDLANQIGDLFAGLIKGDLGFGDVMKKILEIAWSGLQQLWNWFKNTEVGKWLINNWKKILGTILSIFLAWSLLKIAGSALANALFGGLLSGAKTVFSKVGDLIANSLGWAKYGSGGGFLYAKNWVGTVIQVLAAAASALVAVVTIKLAFDVGADEGKQTAWGEQSDAKGWVDTLAKSFGIGLVGGAAAGGLALLAGAAATAFLPITLGIAALAVAVGSVAYEVTKSNEQFKIQQGLLMDSEYYTNQLAEANDELELMQLRVETQQTRYNKALDKAKELFNQLSPAIRDEYGNSLDTFIEKTDYGTTLTGNLTSAEQDLKDQLSIVKTEFEAYNDANDKLAKTKEKILKLETLSSIASDVEAKNYELAAARIELAVEQGILTVDEGSRLMQGAFENASKSERDNMLQNMEPELRAKFLAYLASTKQFQDDYMEYYRDANAEVKRLISDPSVTKAMEEAGLDNAEALRRGLQNATVWDKFKAWWYDLIPGGKTGDDIFIEVGLKTKSLASFAGSMVASMDVGTNYVPNDGLVYLHQGEAVIPKKYNNPYQPPTASLEEQSYMRQMMSTMRSLDNTMKQGISVNGQFVQRGSDLVAVVNRTKSQTGADLLSNVSYAR